MEREVGERWRRVSEMVPLEDGARMWGAELVKCIGYHMGDPDAESVDHADAYLKSVKSAARLARKLNKRDGLRGEAS